jgi:predicted nucleic acid-binding protein
MTYLADTNILLRFLLRNDPAYPTVRRAVRLLKSRREQLVTTPQNIAEFWNVCTRPATARGGLGLSVEATDMRVRLLERHFRVLPDTPAIYPMWRTLVLAHNVSGVQVHDARIVAAMLVHGVTHLITFNVRDFNRYQTITVVAPDDVT